MSRFIAGRVAQTVLTMLLASVVVFLMLRLIPGDPVRSYVPDDAPPEVIEAVTERFGLDRPLPVQYWAWLGNAVQGDLGTSYRSGSPVTTLMARTFPATIELAMGAFLFAVVLGMLTGTVAALKPGRTADTSITTYNSVMLGIPNFWVGIVFIIVFALWLDWLPAGGRVSIVESPIRGMKHLLLPAFALSLTQTAVISRFMRASLLGTLQEDYIRTATAKGMRRSRVVAGHAFRNAMIPVITIMGVEFGRLLGGAVVMEAVFSWPGIGRLIVQSVNGRDYLVVQALILSLVLIFLVVNLLVDLSYSILDPRIKLGRKAEH